MPACGDLVFVVGGIALIVGLGLGFGVGYIQALPTPQRRDGKGKFVRKDGTQRVKVKAFSSPGAPH